MPEEPGLCAEFILELRTSTDEVGNVSANLSGL